MTSHGVICDRCGCWYSEALRRPGEKCGDLSYANGTPDDLPCPGICRPRKKPYSKPVLHVYGDIKDMTNASLMGTMSDHHMARIGHKTA
jgi:hypothetical protein